MKLFSTNLEIKTLKTICKSKDLGGYLLASVNEDFFNHPVCKAAYNRIKKILTKKNYIMDWDELLSDPTIDETARETLEEQSLKPIKDKEKAVNIVKRLDDYRKLRSLTLMADNILQTVKGDNVDIDELFNESADSLNKAKYSANAEDCFIHIGAQNNANDVVKEILKGKAFEYVPTGFRAFDDVNRGLPTKSLITIAGPTGAGKSLFSQQMAMNMAAWGAKTCYVPLEMGGEELMQRMLANLSDTTLDTFVNADKKLVGNIKQQKKIYHYFKKFRDKLAAKNNTLSIFNPPEDYTIEELLFFLKPYNYKCIIIDYLGLLAGVDGDDQWQRLGAAARFAKVFADATNSVVIVCAQLSEEGKVRYSRAISEHSTALFSWTMDEVARETGIIQVVMQKARNMNPAPFSLKLDYPHMAVVDVDESEVKAAEEQRVNDSKATKKEGKKAGSNLDPELLDV